MPSLDEKRDLPQQPGDAGLRSALAVLETLPLWGLDIAEVTGHNLEAHGREEVNRLLQSGWRLLHVYTLKYREDNTWRERPMAILGRPRNVQRHTPKRTAQPASGRPSARRKR